MSKDWIRDNMSIPDCYVRLRTDNLCNLGDYKASVPIPDDMNGDKNA